MDGLVAKLDGKTWIGIDKGVFDTCVEWTIDENGCIQIIDFYEVNT